jgi:hypothetical protein
MSDKYRSWKAKNEKHDLGHGTDTKNRKEDFSCRECHPMLVTNKKFIRFWKWYMKYVPEVKDYSGKTEEIFTELLTCIREKCEGKRSKDIDNRIKGKIGKLLGNMRYEESPKKTEREIGEELLVIIAASNSFEKSMKETKELYDEYLSSEAESLASESEESIIDEPVGEIVEEMENWYEKYVENIREHQKLHSIGKEGETKSGWKGDISCRKCHPIEKGIENDKEFMEFWKWYSKLTTAESFSGRTIHIFRELQKIDYTREQTYENLILPTMLFATARYSKRPNLEGVRIKIIEILAMRKAYSVSLKEAVEKLRQIKKEEKKKMKSEEVTKDISPKKTHDSKKKGTIIEELTGELEKIEENTGLVQIKCGKHGPYEIHGKGERYEIEFNDKDNAWEVIPQEEFEAICENNKLDTEKILEEIRNHVQKKREKDNLTKGKEKQMEQNEEELFEESGNENVEKDINTGPKSLEKKREDKILSDSNSESEENTEMATYYLPRNIIEVKDFSGKRNEDAEEWIEGFEEACKANKWPDNERLDIATVKLTGNAKEWYKRKKNDITNGWGDKTTDASFVKEFISEFKSEERENDLMEELWNLRQIPGESVDTYIGRFYGISRRVSDTNVPEAIRIKLLVRGLIAVLYEKVIMKKNNTLAKAIENIRRAEKSVMGVKHEDPFLSKYTENSRVYENLQKEKADKKSIDDLVEQMERKLEIKLLRKLNYMGTDRRNRNNNDYSQRKYERRDIECYRCHKKGHIATACPEREQEEENKQQHYKKNNRREKRGESVNNLRVIKNDYEDYEYGDNEDDGYSEDERKVFENQMTTRSGKRLKRNETIEEDEEEEEKLRNELTPEEKRKRQIRGLEKGYMKRMKENKCSICKEIGHFATDCPKAYCHKCEKFGHLESSQRYHRKEKQTKKDMVIGEQTKKNYQLVTHILKNLGKIITKERVYKELQKYEKGKDTYFLKNKGKPGYIPATCEVNIQGVEVEAVIDSGSGVTVITKGLLEKTPYEILEPSEARFVPFAEENPKRASLGIIKNMEFFIGDTKTIMDVEVVDSPVETFLLGTDWMNKEKPCLNFKRNIMTIKRKGEEYEVPIRYIEEEIEYEEESEDELSE